ncbi:MAG TPA: M28 family peptidase [Anaeromyxobacteraceae bacterium]|nr:M28 family peptidase [Anaeromyxobacteraceae bacterium]
MPVSSAYLVALAAALRLAAPPAAAAPTLTPAEQAAAARVSADEISGHLRFLSDDLLEGRAPGERGDELAVKYLAAQLEAAGLKPGLPGEKGRPASWFQQVPLVKLTAQVPPTVEVRGPKGASLQLSTRGGKEMDLIVAPGAEVERVKLADSELVFVGYGISAPEFGWDDYRGADVRGKVVVILNFNPPFAGDGVRLWYGRWDYKYENAARHGAAAAVIVHTTPSASYPWQVLTASADGTETALPQAPGEARVQSKMWVSEPAARRLFALAGQDLDERTRAAGDAKRRGLGAAPLGLRLSLDMPVARVLTPSANVVGVLPGSDPELAKEHVVYSAHHDHLGVVAAGPGKDGIYNGAIDNASGCATVLAIARAAAAAPPRRSLLFVFFTAEEKGLLGARWLARHPPTPPGRLVAIINLDAVNVLGRTSDVGVLGLGKSSVDGVIRDVAAAQGRSVHGDAFPDRGSFYRSDHFELAKVGVPTVAVKGGPHYLGRPEAWGREQQKAYEQQHYHQPSDEYPPAPSRWDLSGTVEDAQLQLVVGLRLADADELPRWTPGDEFEQARVQAAR